MALKICSVSGQQFEVNDEDLKFYEQVGPVVCGEKFIVTAPTICPTERFRKRLAWRNERNLYRTTCALSGKPLISSFSPDKKLKVCDRTLWYQFDNTQFGRDFDFKRPFFEQFGELQQETYKPNVSQNGEMDNSEYCHFAGRLKNCYMAFDSGMAEDLQYTVFVGYSRDIIDGLLIFNSELCYDGVKLDNCYEALYCSFCQNCSFSAWLTDCIGCTKCLGCLNLRNQKFHIFNQPVSEAEFNRQWNEIFCGSQSAVADFSRRYEEFLSKEPHRALRNIDSPDCVGDVLTRCENANHCYHCLEARNIKYCHYVYLSTESCYDVNTWGEDMQFCMELSGCGGFQGSIGIQNCLFGVYLYYGAYDVLYSVNCLERCQNLFGCADLYKKNYCILNKQYSKEEYEKLLYRILKHMQETGEWGQFFPMHLSPYGYNESNAQEELPLTKEQALALGARWCDYVAERPKVAKIFSPAELPQHKSQFDESLLSATIRCTSSGAFFKLNKKELEFYKNLGLPIPQLSFIERHRRRFQRMNPRSLFPGVCATTGRPLMTSYPSELGYRVVSEQAYAALMS